MSWYIKTSRISEGQATGSHWTSTFGPGKTVPVSGIYRCIGCNKEVTCNADDPFPPQNHHQHTSAQGAIQWKLNVRANTEGK